jgi:Anti-sigma-28 factor, FlgM
MSPDTPEPRTMDVETLKARVARDDYVVDPHAVAEALLRRAIPRRESAHPAAPTLVRRRAGSPKADGLGQSRRG